MIQYRSNTINHYTKLLIVTNISNPRSALPIIYVNEKRTPTTSCIQLSIMFKNCQSPVPALLHRSSTLNSEGTYLLLFLFRNSFATTSRLSVYPIHPVDEYIRSSTANTQTNLPILIYGGATPSKANNTQHIKCR